MQYHHIGPWTNMQGLSNWLMGIFVSENDLIICQATPASRTSRSLAPLSLLNVRVYAGLSQFDVVSLVFGWRLSKLEPQMSVGNRLSHHVIDPAQLVYASVEVNLLNLLSFLTFACQCHSIFAPSNSPEMSVNACLAFEESTRPRVNPRDMELGREPRLPPFAQTGSLPMDTIVA